MCSTFWIESPDDPQLDVLRDELAAQAANLEDVGVWPAQQLEACGRYGVYRWFVPEEFGGVGWQPQDIAKGYLKLSAGCLTTTFIITQYTGAARRIASSENAALQRELLPQLAAGEIFSTVGISHLTTSQRHLGRPVLRAEETDQGFRLNGTAPWVTGAKQADNVVIGATLDDGREILTVVPTHLIGVDVPEPARLVALNASQTGPIHFHDCVVDRRYLLAGPVEGVMKQGLGARTGGVQTSTLAVGVANAAIEFLLSEAQRRTELLQPAEALREDASDLEDLLLRAAMGDQTCSDQELRTRANSLALRSAQAALAAAKGAGFVVGHPAGRWCREALFFLVWSCPQPVMAANLCELAGLAD